MEEESRPAAKKNAHFPHQKNPPHQTAFSCNYPIQASIIAAVIITVSFFLTSGLIYRCIMLISRWFLSLICGMTKALNDQNSSNQNSQPPYPPSNAIWKTLLQLLLLFFLFPPFFISNFINFFWPHSSCDCIAYKLIKYNQFRVSENKPDETCYVTL